MLISAIPKGQHESTRREILRRIAELEARIVPGLNGSTVQQLMGQILDLEARLKPEDDKRNPKHYRRKSEHTESWPVRHWNREDWDVACWVAKREAGGICAICATAQVEKFRLLKYPDDHRITGEHVDAVCAECFSQFPPPEVCPYA